MSEKATFFQVVQVIFGILGMFAVVFVFFGFMFNNGFDLMKKLSSEGRLETYVNKKCIEGNEVAIKIKKRGFHRLKDEKELVISAIEGNESAYRALGLDKKYYTD